MHMRVLKNFGVCETRENGKKYIFYRLSILNTVYLTTNAERGFSDTIRAFLKKIAREIRY